jgi:hypothetical protein
MDSDMIRSSLDTYHGAAFVRHISAATVRRVLRSMERPAFDARFEVLDDVALTPARLAKLRADGFEITFPEPRRARRVHSAAGEGFPAGSQ